MTVTYTLEVSRARFWGFAKLLARWRGSVYRLMYRETAAFLTAYYSIAFLYRHCMDDIWQRKFEAFSIYCRELLSVVPITFILGFYLSFVVGRWWQQYMAIPWPDRLAIQISAYVQGADERGRVIRRSLVRYLNLISVLTFQQTSTIIKCRFPTLDHMVEAGIMTPDEKAALEQTPTPHGIWWIPAQWYGQLAMKARKEGRIHDDLHLKSLIDEMVEFRGLCGTIWSYDWISVPLSYTQVVAIAVYSFFVSCLFGRQYLYKNPDNGGMPSEFASFDVDFYFPVFTLFQFVFYVGWLKVAEGMICPFGEDDDDFELNWIIDRNIQVSYLIVDQMYQNGPKIGKDALWDDVETDLPYTQAAALYRQVPYFGSTQAMNISDRLAEWNLPEQMPPIDEEEAVGGRNLLGLSREALRLGRKHKKGDKSSEGTTKSVENFDDSECSSALHSARSSDEDEDGQRSTGSRQVEERHKCRRLRDLPPGYSRNDLASRLGSKLSLTSLSSKRKRLASPPTSVSRHSKSRAWRLVSRTSSSGRLDLSDGNICNANQHHLSVSEVIDETPTPDVAHISHHSNFTPAQIDVPPPLAEEPDSYYHNNTDSAYRPQTFSHTFTPEQVKPEIIMSTSRSPLIPKEADNVQ